MNALTNDFPPAHAAGLAELRPNPLAGQWSALQDVAAAVAGLAGLAAEPPSAATQDFPALIQEAGGWRFQLACTGIDDLAAIMAPGVKALLAVSARGQDPTAAALTLWREYHHARAALLALIPEHDLRQTGLNHPAS